MDASPGEDVEGPVEVFVACTAWPWSWRQAQRAATSVCDSTTRRSAHGSRGFHSRARSAGQWDHSKIHGVLPWLEQQRQRAAVLICSGVRESRLRVNQVPVRDSSRPDALAGPTHPIMLLQPFRMIRMILDR